MRFLKTLALIPTLTLLLACSTTVQSSRRINELQSQPSELFFVWSSWRQPAFSNLPALGAGSWGTPGSKYFENYSTEHASFGASLQQALEGAPSLRGRVSVARLPTGHTPEQHSAAMNRAKRSAAVVLMYPERVTSYCMPGCYAFKVRVSYLSPVTRAVIWTGLIDSPPKTKHSDPFDAVATSFADVLMKQFSDERLLPREPDA